MRGEILSKVKDNSVYGLLKMKFWTVKIVKDNTEVEPDI